MSIKDDCIFMQLDFTLITIFYDAFWWLWKKLWCIDLFLHRAVTIYHFNSSHDICKLLKINFQFFPLHYFLWLTLGYPDHNNDNDTKYDADANDNDTSTWTWENSNLNIVCVFMMSNKCIIYFEAKVSHTLIYFHDHKKIFDVG